MFAMQRAQVFFQSPIPHLLYPSQVLYDENRTPSRHLLARIGRELERVEARACRRKSLAIRPDSDAVQTKGRMHGLEA